MSEFRPTQIIYFHAIGINSDGHVDVPKSFDLHCFYASKDEAVAAIREDDCEGVLYELRPVLVARNGRRRVRLVKGGRFR